MQAPHCRRALDHFGRRGQREVLKERTICQTKDAWKVLTKRSRPLPRHENWTRRNKLITTVENTKRRMKRTPTRSTHPQGRQKQRQGRTRRHAADREETRRAAAQSRSRQRHERDSEEADTSLREPHGGNTSNKGKTQNNKEHQQQRRRMQDTLTKQNVSPKALGSARHSRRGIYFHPHRDRADQE